MFRVVGLIQYTRLRIYSEIFVVHFVFPRAIGKPPERGRERFVLTARSVLLLYRTY